MVALYLIHESALLLRHVLVRTRHSQQALSLHLPQVVFLPDVRCDRVEQALEVVLARELAEAFELDAELDSSRFDLVEGQAIPVSQTPRSL